MRLPEFTAAASLYASSQSYHRVGTLHGASGVIEAALVPHRQGCFWKCIEDNADDPYAYENCRCICYGHPGRTCFLM